MPSNQVWGNTDAEALIAALRLAAPGGGAEHCELLRRMAIAADATAFVRMATEAGEKKTAELRVEVETLRAELATTKARLDGTVSAIPAIVAAQTEKLRTALTPFVAASMGLTEEEPEIRRVVIGLSDDHPHITSTHVLAARRALKKE